MVGASPPESGLLRDKPTLDALNKMGIDVGTLGNHEFDRGVPEMLRQVNGGQSTVDPSITFNQLNFPVVDANVISDADRQAAAASRTSSRRSAASRSRSSARPRSPPRRS